MSDTHTTTISPQQQYDAAWSKFQAELEVIKRDRTVDVKSEKGKYTFKYATLAATWDTIRKPFTANGFGYTQRPTVDNSANGKVTMQTTITHAGGHREVYVLELPLQARRDPQAIGIVVSYARRYALVCAVGATSEDESSVDDAPQEEQTQRFHTDQVRGPTPTPPPQQAKQSEAAPRVGVVELGVALERAPDVGALMKLAGDISKRKDIDPTSRKTLLATFQKRKRQLEQPEGGAP